MFERRCQAPPGFGAGAVFVPALIRHFPEAVRAAERPASREHSIRLMRIRTLGALVAAALIAPAALAAQQPSGGNAVPQTHTVVKGETLWDLAQRFLGDAHRWPEIYNVNRSTVADPHWIYPGQVLQMPGFVTSVGVSVTPPAEAAPAAAPVAPATVAQTVITMTAPTVFRRETPPAAVDTLTGEVAETFPTVLRGDFMRAPYVVGSATMPGAGRLLGSADLDPRGRRDTRFMFKDYDDVLLEPPAGAAGAKGEKYVVVRRSTSIFGVGQVVIPTGVVEVTQNRSGSAAVKAQVVELYGEMGPDQMVLPLDTTDISTKVRPSPVTDGQWTEIKWIHANPVLPTTQMYVVLGLTSKDGVKPGDDFLVFRKPQPARASGSLGTPEIPIARARAVRVTAFGTTAVVTAQQQPAINVGAAVRVTAKMP